jgi:hypothetical protein
MYMLDAISYLVAVSYGESPYHNIGSPFSRHIILSIRLGESRKLKKVDPIFSKLNQTLKRANKT